MLFLFAFTVWSQQTPQDSIQTGFSLGKIKTPNLNSIESKYTYDPVTNRYIYTETIGEYNIKYPIILTPSEYFDLVAKENIKNYYKEKIDAFDGKKEGSEEAKKNLLPEFYVNSGFFESVFGSNTIELIPTGSVEMDLGVLFSKQDNPTFSPQNRSNFTFDFDQRISLSLLGKVGTRLQVTANYDTQSTFDFQQLIKLEYTPTEDDILQKIEVGNVSMPLNSSLITGAQSLFGVKAQLQFGKTTVTGVFSEQKSESSTVVAQGGGTLQEYEFYIREYDVNRHFFLAQYFRDQYNNALATYPYISNKGLQITRIEVWITNRNGTTDNVRNIVALQDLGETGVVGSAVNVFGASGAYPDNDNNAFNPENIGGANSQINNNIRDISTVSSGIEVANMREGYDYGKLESARKLTENQEYTLNEELGYISLNSSLSNDEVLAVAFQYTVGGKVYQVGEFSSDGVDATEVTTNDDGTTSVDNNSLILKMLKSSLTVVDEPVWDLMMKNIYDTGGYNISQDDFTLNIFYNEASDLNYITPVGDDFAQDINGNPITNDTEQDDRLENIPLLRVFNLDKLNSNGDPQANGDGFFDYEEGITVLSENGKIIFTSVEPFGEYLFDVLGGGDYDNTATYNANQQKYVYNILYSQTQTAALEESEKNRFKLKGRYSSSGSSDAISIGSFNVARGSVVVTAGGRTLVEGIDYVVDYDLGQVEILDESLKASDTPIEVTTENNSVFGQQTKRFTGLNVEHKFNDNFVLGGTLLNLNERPITQKANYGSESVNNTIFGINGNYATKVPFLTRLVNKLPNIDTDVESNLSVRGEFAYLAPGSPSGTDLNGEATSYIDDFEGSQTNIDLTSPTTWFLSSRPLDLGRNYTEGDEDENGIQNGYDRAMLNWYTIDPVFYGSQQPDDISDNDISGLYTSRVFINELFPDVTLVSGQNSVLYTLDLAYYPTERGPYNFNPTSADGVIDNPQEAWAGITRQLTSTDFEQQNVEYIEFWLQDPFLENTTNTGGKLVFNLGNISEDIVKDGQKLYENGLPEDGDVSLYETTSWGSVVPQNQSLVYAFDTSGDERTNQDVGYDGYSDSQEIQAFGAQFGDDPSNDNYTYFLNTTGDIFDRYKGYNGVDGNSPDTFTDTNRGSTTIPDVEDINRDNTMNTIDSYYEYELEISSQNLPQSEADFNNLSSANPLSDYLVDFKTTTRSMPNGESATVRWHQFRIPIDGDIATPIGGITDFRSIRFARIYLKEFSQATVFRFGSLDLVRSTWLRYEQSLEFDGDDPDDDLTDFSIGDIGTLDNEGSYEMPPGIEAEELYNNNTVVNQNEQSLVMEVCGLETEDSRGVYKNVSLDMRQYNKLRMFLHAEPGEDGIGSVDDNELVGFIRIGSDITENFYQIEIPLEITESSADDVWPTNNEIEIELDILAQIKAQGISDMTLTNEDPVFYDVVDGEIVAVNDPFTGYVAGQHRVGIKGNPNYGDVRILMVGVKNATSNDVCGTLWFNELRLSDMDNEGGWAAIVSMDSNIADFATISATGSQSTSGFGSLEQGPSERSLEDVVQYDVVTNVNVGQLFPKKWGIQLPFTYSQSEELITPKYDAYYEDLTLQSRIDAADTEEEKDTILKNSQDYTKRKSINFIGVKKNRTGDKKARFYDVENVTLNYSYNKVEHRDFEIENALNQSVSLSANYAHNFNQLNVEPFKNNDSIFRSKYWKFLKEFNFNLLPTSFNVNAGINRQFTKQKFREIDLTDDDISVEELFSRTYTFDFQYGINYNLTKSLQFNFTASNNNIVRNYYKDNDLIAGEQDETLGVWDGLFDVGDPNRQSQTLGITYQLPFNKIPTFSFIDATYQYTGNFLWQKTSDLYGEIELYYTDPDDETNEIPGTFNLGNSVQNSSVHNFVTTLDMTRFYKYIGLVKKPVRTVRTRTTSAGGPPGSNQRKAPAPKKQNQTVRKLLNAGIDILTSVKRVNFNYNENSGTYLPGYTPTPGFIGTLKPTTGFTFGVQSDVRYLAARKGWLTLYPEFNEQFARTQQKQIDFSASLEPVKDLKIDLVGSRAYYENFSENYQVDTDGGNYEYQSLTPNTYGNFNISTVLIKTAFNRSDESTSKVFETFKSNRLKIADKLAQKFYNGAVTELERDEDGYPLGFGKTNQAVLIPAFLSAYSGQDANKTSTSAFRDFPIPNWDLKYTGFMKFKWFKKRFKRFSLTHGYRSTYTINQFNTNLDLNLDADAGEQPIPGSAYAAQPDEALDANGNYKNETIYSNINLSESFSPLMRLDFEMKNSVKILAEIARDRLLSLSFDNNLLTEVQGNEYTIGLGYRIKDLRINSNLAGPQKRIVSDLNMKADISVRENKTIIRYLDLDNNEITSGQTIWGVNYSADYAFSKNLTGIFYFDYTFSDYAISTAYPQTSIRSGITLRYNFGN
ncbi:T9SS outer membrane translocon Sov/SprA [Neotamlana laminarinivorans]|uniref:Cell surface protein SprA n=1 Tax=Neotamlana laminarinivorans TaxID=2883124 RepID=A0A9X1I148_9FLAO|nr:cell surface protein SprA [Tamlana laminarinivorans]MCB4799883.1 cell surface protein SprA [Tamlana laminarinivorans]